MTQSPLYRASALVFQRARAVIKDGVELAAQVLEALCGFGSRSRAARTRASRRHDSELETLVRLHESGQIDTREFQRRRRRLRDA